MKRIIILLSLLALIIIPSKAQVVFSYSIGYTNHDMESMKNKLKNASIGGIKLKVVDNFPGSLTHSLDAGYKFNKLSIGLTGTFMNTGGQLAYADYSGSYTDKVTLKCYRIGFYLRGDAISTRIKDKYDFNVYVKLAPAFTVSTLKEEATLSITGYDKETDKDSDRVYNLSLLPLVGAQFHLNKNISFHLELGYDYNFNKKLAWNKDFKKVTANPVDWSGFRIQAGVSYTIGK